MDLAAPPGSPARPTVDHVVPKAKGGGNEPENLRLAHRRCNGRRGARLPELDWPRDIPVVDHGEIWPAVRRALRRRGEWEVVGVVVGDDAARQAHAWLDHAVPNVLGGDWHVELRDVGNHLHAIALRAAPPAHVPKHRGARRAS